MMNGPMINNNFIECFSEICNPLHDWIIQFSSDLSTFDDGNTILVRRNEYDDFIPSYLDFSRKYLQNIEGVWKYVMSYADSREMLNLTMIKQLLLSSLNVLKNYDADFLK